MCTVVNSQRKKGTFQKFMTQVYHTCLELCLPAEILVVSYVLLHKLSTLFANAMRNLLIPTNLVHIDDHTNRPTFVWSRGLMGWVWRWRWKQIMAFIAKNRVMHHSLVVFVRHPWLFLAAITLTKTSSSPTTISHTHGWSQCTSAYSRMICLSNLDTT